MSKTTSKPITVEGVKGLKSTPFRKTFKTEKALQKWHEKNAGDVEIHRYSQE
jgi:hypothetical protein